MEFFHGNGHYTNIHLRRGFWLRLVPHVKAKPRYREPALTCAVVCGSMDPITENSRAVESGSGKNLSRSETRSSSQYPHALCRLSSFVTVLAKPRYYKRQSRPSLQPLQDRPPRVPLLASAVYNFVPKAKGDLSRDSLLLPRSLVNSSFR